MALPEPQTCAFRPLDPVRHLLADVSGIGTPAPFHNSIWERTKDTIQQSVGLGLTKKIVDRYVARTGHALHRYGKLFWSKVYFLTGYSRRMT